MKNNNTVLTLHQKLDESIEKSDKVIILGLSNDIMYQIIEEARKSNSNLPVYCIDAIKDKLAKDRISSINGDDNEFHY